MAGQAELDRRRFLRRAGTIAWAVPVVLTLTADHAGAQAVSCLPAGAPCGTWDSVAGTCVGATVPCCGVCLETGGDTGDPCLCFL